MNLPTEIFGTVVVVHAPEELGGEQHEEFGVYVTGLDRHNVVVDLDATETLDSKGLEAILEVQETLQERSGEVKISASNPTNRKILEVTRLDDQLEVYDSVIDAVKSFQ